MNIPYYGSAAVAAFMKHNVTSKFQVSHLPLNSDFDAAYCAHIVDSLVRLMIVSLRVHNASAWDGGDTIHYTRPSREYDFLFPRDCIRQTAVQRLMANGSDAISGATWDGFSFNYELDNGLPVRLENITRGDVVNIDSNGLIRVSVPDSSAAMVSFEC